MKFGNRERILLFLLLAAIVGAYAVRQYDQRSHNSDIPPVQENTPASVAHLVAAWPDLSRKIPLVAGESGRWYLHAVTTLDNATLLISFEDGLRGNTAVIRYANDVYEILKVYPDQLRFSATEFKAMQAQYGDPQYTPLHYETSEGDGHLFRISSNLFIPQVETTQVIKVAFLNPDQSLPNQAKPGDITGCDNVVFQDFIIQATSTPLAAALHILLANKNTRSDNDKLYNYLAQGDLKLNSVSIVNGTAKIYLIGAAPALAGECDDPRLFVQIAQTARQFSTVQKVEVYVNGALNNGRSDLGG